jgi:hypothetical protein
MAFAINWRSGIGGSKTNPGNKPVGIDEGMKSETFPAWKATLD